MSCKSLNCTPISEFKANADISGGGVLAAFFSSAVLTLLATTYGYVSESIPDRYLSEVDHTIIKAIPFQRIHETWFASWFRVKKRMRVTLGLKVPTRSPGLTRKQRGEIVTRFVLAMSDQQLVTGLAILVGALANRCTLSTYDFTMGLCLAWFSAITHLVTLDNLQDYFWKNKTVRNWRISGMLSMLTLFLFSLVIKALQSEPSIPIQCLFADPAKFGNTTNFATIMVRAGLIALFLLFSYSSRIFRSMETISKDVPFVYYLTFIHKRYFNRKFKKLLEQKGFTRKQIAPFLEYLEKDRRSVERRTRLPDVDTTRSTFLRRQLDIFVYNSSAYFDSYAASMPVICLMVSFGTSQTILARWTQWIRDDSREVVVELDSSLGFGQVTPLFLLLLPMLTAMEIYYEARNKRELGNAEDANENVVTDVALSPIITATTSQNENIEELQRAAIAYDEDVSLVGQYYPLQQLRIEDKNSSAQSYESLRAVWEEKKEYHALARQFESIRCAHPYQGRIVLSMLFFDSMIGTVIGATLAYSPTNTGQLVSGIVGGAIVVFRKVHFGVMPALNHALWGLGDLETVSLILKHV